jgi:hypothetical protein
MNKLIWKYTDTTRKLYMRDKSITMNTSENKCIKKATFNEQMRKENIEKIKIFKKKNNKSQWK